MSCGGSGTCSMLIDSGGCGSGGRYLYISRGACGDTKFEVDSGGCGGRVAASSSDIAAAFASLRERNR
ncbi:MAG: hypothetical protein Q4D02_02725 [Clostridia bacterium]|nr:hypothetical protein [Clostridia bacterium]